MQIEATSLSEVFWYVLNSPYLFIVMCKEGAFLKVYPVLSALSQVSICVHAISVISLYSLYMLYNIWYLFTLHSLFIIVFLLICFSSSIYIQNNKHKTNHNHCFILA